MQETLQLDELAYAEDSQFSGKFSGAPFTAFDLDFQGQVNTSGSVGLALGGAHALIAQVELRQGQDTILSLDGPELALLASTDEAHAHALNPVVASATDEPIKATVSIDFARLGPVGSMVDAGLGTAEIYMAGRFNPLSKAASGWSAPTSGREGTLRPSVRSASRIPQGGYFRPDIASSKVDLGSGPSDKRTFKFEATGQSGGVLMGFLIRAYNESAKAAGLNAASSDVLIRKVKAVGKTRRYNGTAHTHTWGGMKRAAASYLKTKRDPSGLLPQGVGFIPLVDDAGAPGLRGGLAMSSGDTIELWFDTKSDVEEEFGSAAGTVAASGDQVVITPIYFVAVSTAGTEIGVTAGSSAPQATGAAGRNTAARRVRKVRKPRRRRR